MDPTAIILKITQFLTSGFGIGLFGIIIFLAFVSVATERRFHAAIFALIGCGGAFCAAWFVNTWFA